MAFSTRATKAAAAAAAMLTPKKFFAGGQDASVEADSATAPPSPMPLARMSSAHDGAIMQQLLIMQQRLDERFEEQQLEMQKLLRSEMQQLQQNMQEHMDERLRKLQEELQQERAERCKEMQQLRSDQSTLKAQIIAGITSMDKRNEQLQVEFTEQLRQKEDALLLEMEKLRGNENELQIKINAQMQANADEQAQMLQQSREQEQRMEELRGSTEELRQETARLQGHEQQLQAHNIMLASLLQEMEKLRGNEVEHMDAAHRLEAQHKAIIQNIQELHGNETLLNKKIRALKEELQGTIGHRLDHFVASFKEALDEHSEQEKLRANETQELQKSLKELQVKYQQLRADKQDNTLGNTVREKITATLLSTAQETGEQSKAPFSDPYTYERYGNLFDIIKHIKDQLQQPNCDNILTLRAQLQVAETEYSMLTRAQAEHWQLKVRHTYDNWLRNNPVDASSLTTVCSTKAGAEGGSSDKVCGIDSASSRVDVCNTNDKGAFTPADGENSSGNKPGFGRGRGGQGQRGRGGGQGQRGRGAAVLKPRTSFEDDSDEEAYTTTASVQSNAHSPYAAGVCKSISFENNRMKIVNDIHEQILQTDLQQRFEEGREDALHEQAYTRGRAFGTAETRNFGQDAEGSSDGFSDGLSEAGEERDADRDNDEEREAGEERDACSASVVSCNRITAI